MTGRNVGTSRHFLSHATILGVIIAAVIAIYVPGLTGPFVFDDWVNIVNNDGTAIPRLGITELQTAALSGIGGPFGRPLASITFALNYYFAGGFDNTFGFKLTNLVIHILNTTLVYWLLHLLLKMSASLNSGIARDAGQRRWIAGMAAALWAMHPIQLTSVLYVVQRMNSLAAFFMLAGLISFLHGRQRLAEYPKQGLAFIWSGLIGGMTLGLTSKEIALLLPFYALVIEWIFFSRDTRRERCWLLAAYLPPLAIMAIPALGWLILHGESLSNIYNVRDFSMAERLLTEARVLWMYLGLIVLPTTDRLTLFHDDFAISTGLLIPWATLPAMIGLITAAFAAVWFRKKQPVMCFGVLWFLVGHSMESGFIGLELVHEHRNYFPSIGLLFAISATVVTMGSKTHRKWIVPLATGLLIALFASTTNVMVRYWVEERTLAEYLVRHHPDSARSHAMLAEVLLRSSAYNPLAAVNHYHTAARLEPSKTAYLLRLLSIVSFTRAQVNTDAPLNIPLVSDKSNDQRPLLRLQKDGQAARLIVDDSLFSEITHRLSTEPVDSETESALAKLTECAVKSPDQCRQIQSRLVQWLKQSLDNPRTNNSIRRALWTQLARLQFEQGDLFSALESTQRARSIDPLNTSLAIMEANIRLLAGQKDIAGGILIWLANRPLNLFQQEQLADLNQMLKATP
ncbi:MAG: hypothetical protein HY052_07155 [Proteobacteria bacterium]|nr:hypothetical protein [Pseudomonadota bacterium]